MTLAFRPIAVTPASGRAIALIPTPSPEMRDGALKNIEAWRKINLRAGSRRTFETLYAPLAQTLHPTDLAALNVYLSIHSGSIAQNILLWAPTAPEYQNEARFSAVQALAGACLLAGLMTPGQTEEGVRRETLRKIQRISDTTVASTTAHWMSLFPRPAAQTIAGDGTPHPKVVQFFHEAVQSAKALLQEKPKTPVVRLMAGIFDRVEDFCRRKGLPNHVRNVSIGDVMPAGLPDDIRERMALDLCGPKSLAVTARSEAARLLAYRGGADWHRYDIPALGLTDLRSRFVDYASVFGLYTSESRPAETLIAAGGQHGLAKALAIARRRLNEAGIENPSVHFSNPGLRMIAAIARELGFKVHESTANPNNHFFPTAVQMAQFFDEHPDCKIFIHTPMGNPNGAIADPDETAALFDVLRARGIIVINDFAYLGTGDMERTRRVCEAIRTYPNRLDVIAMTKFFGRPALRCSCVLTPDTELADRFKQIAQDFQPTESYAMQFNALALWDLVTLDDRRAMAEVFQKRQAALIERLRAIDGARRAEGKTPLIDPSQPIAGDASLYVMVPLMEGTDPWTLITETGLLGVPAKGFFASGQQGWMRFSVGIMGV